MQSYLLLVLYVPTGSPLRTTSESKPFVMLLSREIVNRHIETGTNKSKVKIKNPLRFDPQSPSALSATTAALRNRRIVGNESTIATTMANAADAAYYNDEFYLRVYMGHRSRQVQYTKKIPPIKTKEIFELIFPHLFFLSFEGALVMSLWYVSEPYFGGGASVLWSDT